MMGMVDSFQGEGAGVAARPGWWLSGGLPGFFAGLGVGLLLVGDPGVGLVQQLGHREQVVEAEAVGLPPGVVALLVAAGGVHAVPGALLAGVAPDGDLQGAAADLVCRFGHGG